MKQDISINLNLIMNLCLVAAFFGSLVPRFVCGTFGCGTLSSGNDNHRLVSNAFFCVEIAFSFHLCLLLLLFAEEKTHRTHKAARLLGDADGILVLGEFVQLPTYPVIV